MKAITNNEMLFVLRIFKTPEIEYNANNISKALGISSMGALKIARRLEKEQLVTSYQLGKAKFYKLSLNMDYTKNYIKLILKREAEQSPSYIKRWISEIKKIKNAYSAILFGSIVRGQQESRDIDVLLITDKKRFLTLKKELEEINSLNIKKIHPLYQTKSDFKNNIKKQDKPILNAIKGIVIFGEDILIGLLKNESCKK